MAREQWHRWGQTAVTIVTLIFVCGLTYSNITHNTTDIAKTDEKVAKVIEDVHIIQINQAEKIATDKAIAQSLSDLKNGLNSIKSDQAEIKTNMAIMRTKVGTLIKDD